MPAVDIYLNVDLHPGQLEVYNSPARFRVLNCGRRWGKSVTARAEIYRGVTQGLRIAYMCPTSKMLAEMWRTVKNDLAPIIKEKNEQQYRIVTINGAIVDMWSLDNPDGPRGREYDLVVIDEAAVLPSGNVWQEVVRPTLMSTHGRAFFASTPKGYNWFWQLYRLGQSDSEPEWACWQKPTVNNPHIDPAEVESARRTTPLNIFAQEYEAKFIADSGSVFRRLEEAAIAPEQTEPIPGHTYVIGADLAKNNDFSVFTVIDVTLMHVCYIDKGNHVDYKVQKERLVALAKRFHAAGVIVEQNANLAFMEQLVDTGLPIMPFVTSGSSKALIIEALAAGFDNLKLLLLDPIHQYAQQLLDELQAFQMERLPSGSFRYSGPRELHDDMVLSLALAFHGATYTVPSWSPEIVGPEHEQLDQVMVGVYVPDPIVAWPVPGWMQ